MKARKRKALGAAGWKVGTVQELLGLDDAEAALIEMKVALVEALRARRAKRRMTQAALAELIGSSQPRVAAMEKGDASLDLLMRSLLALGASPREIGSRLGRARSVGRRQAA